MSIRLLLLIAVGCVSDPVLSQSYFTIFAGNDTILPCTQSCLTLKARIPDIRSTEDYKVISIPYHPFAYTTAAPALTRNCLNQDDKFYDTSNLGFNFCFFGQTYNRCVIGTNGLVTFDLSNALKCNNYVLTGGVSLPFHGTGIGCATNNCTATPTGVSFPYAAIMGVYHDIDIDYTTSARRKVEFRVEGNAPYQVAIASFNAIPFFSCSSLFATHQIVMYESTGLIDVYIADKPICNSSGGNGGLAIVGIQNQDASIGRAPPNRNNTQWGTTGMNEAWRFVPNGTTSLFKKVELFRGNTLIATGDTISLGTGELGVSFNNVCTTSDTSAFRVVATYIRCDNPANLITAEDTIQVLRTGGLPVTAGFTPASCASGGTGVITVTNPIGTNYQYSIDNGATYQLSPVFTVPGGTYSIIARNQLTSCIGSASVTIPIIETIRFATNVFNATCYGTATGQVLVVAQAGASPFQYSADGGATYQGSNLFRLPAGTHTVRVKDNNNCTKDTIIIITQPDSISIAPPLVKAAYCSGNPDGQIIITPAGGTPAYKYALNNSAYQVSDTLFTNVGSFTVYVKDNNGCIDSIAGISVPLNDTMRLQALPDTSVCVGSSITIIPNTNATTFSWSPNTFINDATSARPVVSPQDTITYYLRAGLGTLCSRTDTFVVQVLKLPIPDAGPDTTICFGTKAFFHATAVRGNGFRWSPATNLSSSVIPDPVATGIAPITYVVEVTDPYGCNFKEYDSLRLTVRPKVRAFAGQDTTATLGIPVQLYGCCMDLYHWTPSFVFVNDTARNPIGNFPPGTTQVIMITTTPEGCEGRDTVLVKGYQGPTYYVPSAFSPGNRDGLNDVFRPTPVGITETYYFSVFNRFGQLVYTTKTFMEGWDGRWKGEPVPEGAYVWMVKGMGIDGKIVEKKGTVVLMR